MMKMSKKRIRMQNHISNEGETFFNGNIRRSSNEITEKLVVVKLKISRKKKDKQRVFLEKELSLSYQTLSHSKVVVFFRNIN